MVLPYHTIGSEDSDHTIVWVLHVPSDPIHFNVFWYDCGIQMTNDYDMLLIMLL